MCSPKLMVFIPSISILAKIRHIFEATLIALSRINIETAVTFARTFTTSTYNDRFDTFDTFDVIRSKLSYRNASGRVKPLVITQLRDSIAKSNGNFSMLR